jgi:Di-haem oxidoreductase, putative peroxidase
MSRVASRSALSWIAVLCVGWSATVFGQLVDRNTAPNTANEGIGRALIAGPYPTQIGDGRTSGDANASINVIAFDPFRAIRRGRQLFQRKFTRGDGNGPNAGDGAGNIETDLAIGAGLADSCAACHGRPRGAAGFGGDVVTRPDSRDAPHLFGLGLKEMLADEITGELRAIRDAATVQAVKTGAPAARGLSSKGISYGVIRAWPDGSVDASAVQGVDADLRVRPFFAHGGTISIREFVVGALKNEMGLAMAGDPDLLAAQHGRVLTPSGMVLDGSLDTVEQPPVEEGDIGTIDQRTALVDFLEFYLLNYFKPGTGEQTPEVLRGRKALDQIGCTVCHVANLPINRDRRRADVETMFDPARGHFNRLFASARLLLANPESLGKSDVPKMPALQACVVQNIFTDFKRHDLGPNFYERNYDGTVRTHFLTTPLWGVGSTAPYGHDGRSINLLEVILRHGGEAEESRNAFAALDVNNRSAVLAFLGSLILFPPDDTASNLDPGDPRAPGFPQFRHGSIKLSALFNTSSIVE